MPFPPDDRRWKLLTSAYDEDGRIRFVDQNGHGDLLTRETLWKAVFRGTPIFTASDRELTLEDLEADRLD